MLLAHDIDGVGDPVLLLHSSVCDRRMWQPQWEPLRDAGFQVVRVDFQGYGETPAPVVEYDNAADVVEVLDQLGLDRVAVVGASFGGRVAQELAARWPDRVDRLVLLCAAMATDQSTEERLPTDAIEAFSRGEQELLEQGALDEAVQLNLRTFLGPAATDETRVLVAEMQRHNFEVGLAAPDVPSSTVDYDLAAVTARTLVVSGAHDVDYFVHVAEVLAERIPGATRTHLDWAGHLPNLEDPARLTPLVLDFLQGADPTP